MVFAFRTPAKQAVRILMFHRIGELYPGLQPIAPKDAVALDTFRRIIRNVAQHGTPVSLPEFVRRTGQRSVTDRLIVVTFDDGFTDNLTHALPVLEEFGVPATVFVATGFTDRTTIPYQYVLARLLCDSQQLTFDWCGRTFSYPLGSESQRRDCYSTVYRMLRKLSVVPRTELLTRLTSHRDRLQEFQDQYLSWDQLKALSASDLMTIGAHTHNHVLMNSVSSGTVSAEAATCRTLLEQHLHRRVRHFSYPHGGHNRFVRRTVRRLGYQSAVAVDRRDIWTRDLFQIQRLCVSTQLEHDPQWLPF